MSNKFEAADWDKEYPEDLKRQIWSWWTSGEEFKDVSQKAWKYIHSKWITDEGGEL